MFPTGEHPSGFCCCGGASSLAARVNYKMTELWGGLRAAAQPLRFGTMRNRGPNRLRAAIAGRRCHSIREHGDAPSSRQVDKLLDERLALRPLA